MSIFVEEKQEFSFPLAWDVVAFDKSVFYNTSVSNWQFRVCVAKETPTTPAIWSRAIGQGAVDFIAWDPTGRDLHLIEVKDYRIGAKVVPAELPDVLARKTRDTLAALALAQTVPASDVSGIASKLPSCGKLSVWLDVNWPTPAPGSLQPSARVLRMNLLLGVRRCLGPVKNQANVVDRTCPTPWSVRDLS